MARRRALIVDDSKTAQMRLRKMLERFDLDVDTSMSAEEALGYLTYRQPAVIFLDHHMEGMDGLEALKIIKSNPATALIPVIMYTSEQGDVYVGQARALGAIDIIGKEIIKQADLKKVLQSLGIGPRGQAEEAPAAAAAAQAPSEADTPTVQFRPVTDEPERAARVSPAAAPAPVDANSLDQVQKQISRLFEIHITKVRQEIEDNTKFLFRRLTKEIQEKNKQNRASNVTVAPPPEPVYPPEPVERSGVPAIFAAVLLFAFAFLGFQLYSNSRDREVQREQIDQLLEQVRQNEATTASVLARLNGQPQAQGGTATFADRQIMLDALSWAVNVNTQVDFGQQALDDQRIYMLGEMLGLLKAANFAGVVYLDVHMGNFCVVEDPSGRLILPEPEANLEDCRFLADIQPEVPLSEQVSVGFLNYLQSAPVLSEGNVDVEMSSQGYSTPRFSYPPTTGAVSAGEWNAVAQKNNRIAVSFSSN